MIFYLLKRLILIIPTLFGIISINFIIIQFIPGTPIDRIFGKIRSNNSSLNIMQEQQECTNAENPIFQFQEEHPFDKSITKNYIKEFKEKIGFDKPIFNQFLEMLIHYVNFNFGISYFYDQKVIDLIISKLLVSISLGLWATILIYSISIPIGILKSTKNGSLFDIISSFIIVAGYAVPGFIIAIILIIFFAGGEFLSIFPLRGLFSENWNELNLINKIFDYFWHLVLPIITLTSGGCAKLIFLIKNSFLEEMKKQYVITAKSKGLSDFSILKKHIFKNAILIILSGFSNALIGIFFTSSLLVEIIFSLDGLGTLAFESILNRDYPVILGSLYIFTFFGLIANIISDIIYAFLDPRINLTRKNY